MLDSVVSFFSEITSTQRGSILALGLMFFWVLEGFLPFRILNYNKLIHATTNIFLTLTTIIVNFSLAFLIVLACDFISSSELTFEVWNNFFYSPIIIFLTLCFIVSLVIHSFIGLWTVGTDYLTRRTIGFLSYRISKYADIFRSIYTVVFSLFGLSYLIVSLSIIFNNIS